jgi:hypothetical protein
MKTYSKDPVADTNAAAGANAGSSLAGSSSPDQGGQGLGSLGSTSSGTASAAGSAAHIISWEAIYRSSPELMRKRMR